MSVEKVKVTVDVDESQAVAGAKRVQREMKEVEADAKQAQSAVNRARTGDNTGLRARFRGLLGKAGIQVRDEDVTLGRAFKFSSQGFGVRETFKKGQFVGGGANVLAAGFAVSVAAQGLSNSFEAVAEIRDYLDENPNATTWQATREMGRQAYINALSENSFSSLVKNFMRATRSGTVGNLSSEDADLYVRSGIQQIFGDVTDLDRAIDGQKAQRQAFFKWQEQQEKDTSKLEEAARDAIKKIDERTEEQIGKLRTQIARPKDIRLNREQNARFQTLFRRAAEKKLREEAVSAKEAPNQVLLGEGR